MERTPLDRTGHRDVKIFIRSSAQRASGRLVLRGERVRHVAVEIQGRERARKMLMNKVL